MLLFYAVLKKANNLREISYKIPRVTKTKNINKKANAVVSSTKIELHKGNKYNTSISKSRNIIAIRANCTSKDI